MLVRGGSVVDGTGGPRRRADVGVRDGRIAAVGDLGRADARRVIEATGRVVAPGFIDVHAHSELAILAGALDATGGLVQGVTTNLTGPDGFGWAGLPSKQAREIEFSLRSIHGRVDLPFDWPTPESYLRAFEGISPVNIAAQVPHLPIRVASVGWEARRAAADELDQMRAATSAWLDAGAIGFCTGLDYQPTCHSDTDELVALAAVGEPFGVPYAAHGRHIEFGRVGAFEETVDVGARAGVGAHVSHERVDDEVAELLANAPETTSDSHLYEAGSTHLIYYVPFREQTGGPAAVLERLADPDYAAGLAAALDDAFGLEPVVLDAWFSATKTGRHIGKSLFEIAEETGRPAGETVVTLMRDELPDALMVYPWGPTEAEFRPTVAATLQHPRVMVSSDGLYHGQRPHPRGFGTFPRAIRIGVRELGAVTLEAAINGMTALPAERFNLADRGRIAEGFAADLVVFDPDTIADRATYAEPRLPPIGIDHVVVNGVVAVDHGRVVNATAGRVLRRA
jgi:N-acyl-D-amino-acid deacylase